MVSSGSYMWFGIPGRNMQWVPAPQSGLTRNWNAAASQLALEDGRQVTRVSAQRYSQFQGEYFGDARELTDIDVFNQFSAGFYGSGPIVFADPYAARNNVFAPHWASPGLVEQGWAPLTRGLQGTPPRFGSVTASQSYGRPGRYASFDIETSSYGVSSPSTQYNHYIAIPPDSTLYLGYSGAVTGTGGVFVQTYDQNNVPSGVVELIAADYNSGTQLTDSFVGSETSAVRVFLSRTDTTQSSVTLFSMMGQVWPNAITPSSNGVFIAGQGHMGLRVSGDAIAETYNYNGIKKGLSLTLEEVA